MSEPKVLHEWTLGSEEWRVIKGQPGYLPGLQVKREGFWCTVLDTHARIAAAEILRLRELVGEEMTRVELGVQLAPYFSSLDSGTYIYRLESREIEELASKLLRRKEQP